MSSHCMQTLGHPVQPLMSDPLETPLKRGGREEAGIQASLEAGLSRPIKTSYDISVILLLVLSPPGS